MTISLELPQKSGSNGGFRLEVIGYTFKGSRADNFIFAYHL